MKVAHKAETLTEKYPNKGTTTEKEIREAAEENYWQNRDIGELRKKYIQFNVLMDLLNGILELPENSTFEQLGRRSYQLVTINLDEDAKP